MSDVTQILAQIEQGDPKAAEELLPLVYDELRKLAAAKLAQERPGQTLQPTALVHEAYLGLVRDGADVTWNSRGHFFGAAAEAMRRILVDNARRRKALKRGGSLDRDELSQLEAGPTTSVDLLALSEAIEKLEHEQPQAAAVVKLRYFVGMTIAEAANSLGISVATADRYWAYARARLHADLKSDD